MSKTPTPDEARDAAQEAGGKPDPVPSRAPFPVPDEAMFYGVAGEIVNSVDPFTEAARPASCCTSSRAAGQ